MNTNDKEKPAGDVFRRSLARVTGRIPSEKETSEAFGRVRVLLQIFDDIRNGRNGMRRDAGLPAKRVRLKLAVRRTG